MLIYSTPECHLVEFYGEGILCASYTKNGFFTEEWQNDEDYTIFK